MSNHKIDQHKNIAWEWIKAFNDHDLEKLLSLYAEDAVHFSPKLKLREPQTNGKIKGKTALRKWWQDAFERLPTLHYELKNLVADEAQVVMEYLRQVEAETDMMVAEILEIENMLIIRSRVYHG